MKTALALTVTALALFTANAAEACRITLKGHSSLTVSAVHETLDQSESMIGYRMIDNGALYEATVETSQNQTETRVFRIENSSRMCPVLKAIRVK